MNALQPDILVSQEVVGNAGANTLTVVLLLLATKRLPSLSTTVR
jgi:hypothetical protein